MCLRIRQASFFDAGDGYLSISDGRARDCDDCAGGGGSDADDDDGGVGCLGVGGGVVLSLSSFLSPSPWGSGLTGLPALPISVSLCSSPYHEKMVWLQ